MFGALKALSNSEKAVAVGVLVIAATVMVFTGHLTVDQWIEYTEWMAVVYVGGKTVQGGVEAMAKRAPAAPATTAGPAVSVTSVMSSDPPA